MRWKTPIVGQEAAQKVEPLPAPQPDLDEILHPAERRAQHHEQDFGQRIDHAPLLARIGQSREVIQDRRGTRGLTGHGTPRTSEALHESHTRTIRKSKSTRRSPEAIALHLQHNSVANPAPRLDTKMIGTGKMESGSVAPGCALKNK